MDRFISNLKVILEQNENDENIKIESARALIRELNRFLYTNYKDIGTTDVLDRHMEYFSDFHKYWEVNFKEILNPTIDEKQCGIVANALHEVYESTPDAFMEIYNNCGLGAEDLCKVRFYSAPQDFKGSINFEELADVFNSDPSIFDARWVFENPQEFLSNIGVSNRSQNDKRISYAKNTAEFLIERKIEPYELLTHYELDIAKLRSALVGERGMGFGNKKADMFLRDMAVQGVWNDYYNFDSLDVASDINTMKVALRTRIFQTSIPLVSSFLDIFCHQYSYMDEINAKAWRRVWEIWAEKWPDECVASPCMMDYFIYKIIGKECCGEKLHIFEGDNCGHKFYWHSGRNQTCQTCVAESKQRTRARSKEKVLPCTTDEEEFYFLKAIQPKYPHLKTLKGCPLSEACKPKQRDFVQYQPPKSISILGKTGWETAYTQENSGGGGLQS